MAGALDVGGGASLTIVFNIATNDGQTNVTLDSPDQGATGIPVAGIERDGQSVSMDVQIVMGKYDGKLSDDGKSISGTWSQGGNSLPLTVTKQ